MANLHRTSVNGAETSVDFKSLPLFEPTLGSRVSFLGFRLNDADNETMSYITKDIADDDYLSQVRAFAEGAALNAAALGLSPEDIELLNQEIGDLDTRLVSVVTARAALSGAVTAKEEQLMRVRKIVAMMAKTWRADPEIPDEVLDQVMVAPHSPRRVISRPSVVTDLVINANGQGEISLKWNPNGNTKGTVYLVETSATGSGPWVVLDAVTSRKFSIEATPGEPIWFRVRAKRGTRVGGFCNPVGMWGARVSGLGSRVA